MTVVIAVSFRTLAIPEITDLFATCFFLIIFKIFLEFSHAIIFMCGNELCFLWQWLHLTASISSFSVIHVIVFHLLLLKICTRAQCAFVGCIYSINYVLKISDSISHTYSQKYFFHECSGSCRFLIFIFMLSVTLF